MKTTRHPTPRALAALAAGAVLALAVTAPLAVAQENRPMAQPKVTAPDFPSGLDWLNTDHPLSLRDLRGKVVVLDFWTYCCINCMHVIPDLKRLEKKYGDALVVIGVHSAKFNGERNTENIRQAILRYGVEHPVVNDYKMQIWNEYGVRAWPTLYLIDPEGKVVGYRSGEGVYDAFDDAIGKLIAEYDKRGLIDRTPMHFAREDQKAPAGVLAFPGKVAADARSDRLYISDSDHNRVIAASLATGDVEMVIGSGAAGLQDGDFQTATFDHPQGIFPTPDGRTLYVADTENHALRRVDLTGRTVTTIAGTGKQADFAAKGGVGTKAALNSPWDLVAVGDSLFVAMAGAHQLWVMDLDTGKIAPYAGSGRENITDGALDDAALAQPSGITTDGKVLYFADSETSSIRRAGIGPKAKVSTLVGMGLFEFGDVDGTGDNARLQHPLAVAYADGVLYVADTYNNKIKRITPAFRNAETFLGTGEAGYRDGAADSARFDEPGGLCVAGGKLYIADTNNHVIRVADLATGEVTTFMLHGLDRLAMAPPVDERTPERLAPVTVAPGADTVLVDVRLPEGLGLTPDAPTQVELRLPDGSPLAFADGSRRKTVDSPRFPLAVPVTATAGKGDVVVAMTVYYCEHGSAARCFFDDALLAVPVTVREGAGATAVRVIRNAGRPLVP